MRRSASGRWTRLRMACGRGSRSSQIGQAGDRAVWDWARGGVSLEGQRDQQCGDPHLGAGRDCEWHAAVVHEVLRSDKPVIGLFGIGLEEAYRWKDSVTSNAEIRIWALDAIANGMRPWFTKFSATLHDQRWLGEIEDIYVWTEKNQHYLAERRPLARVAMVYSQQTAWYYGARVEDYALGWYQALVESRIPFEMVHDRLLDAEHLAP